MERKVIKINLVGAIFVLILIIAIIVGAIVFAIKSSSNNENSDKKNDKTEQDSIFSVNQDEDKDKDKEDYKELDKKENIIVDGEKKEITLRDYRGPRYTFSYEVDGFYKDPYVKDKDSFKSLVSDTIWVEVTYFKDGFKTKAKDLLEEASAKKAENSQYSVKTKEINGKLCYVEELEKENGVKRNYYIENGDAYFLLEVSCGKEFVKNHLPVVEKMVESFEAY